VIAGCTVFVLFTSCFDSGRDILAIALVKRNDCNDNDGLRNRNSLRSSPSSPATPAPQTTQSSLDSSKSDLFENGSSSCCTDDDNGSIHLHIPSYAIAGVDPKYVELFREAERRSFQEYDISHKMGHIGIVVGPTEGDFERHTHRALQNGARIRNVLASTNNTEVKLALVTCAEHIDFLRTCTDNNNSHTTIIDMEDSCRLWKNGTLFDHVIASETEVPYVGNDDHADPDQGSSKFWLKALGGYRLAPYTHSLFLDSDAHPCPGVEKLFSLTAPRTIGDDGRTDFDKIWQLPARLPGDLAIGIEQYAEWHDWTPTSSSARKNDDNNEDAARKDLLEDSFYFAGRNTGVVLFSFRRRISHTLAHFLPLVADYMYNEVARPTQKISNDQTPFRTALYLFHRFVGWNNSPRFVEHQIPMHASCRSYPGWDRAGTDGFLSGMYPPQPSDGGAPCGECRCTPCLVNHNAGVWDVALDVDGRDGTRRMGWE